MNQENTTKLRDMFVPRRSCPASMPDTKSFTVEAGGYSVVFLSLLKPAREE